MIAGVDEGREDPVRSPPEHTLEPSPPVAVRALLLLPVLAAGSGACLLPPLADDRTDAESTSTTGETTSLPTTGSSTSDSSGGSTDESTSGSSSSGSSDASLPQCVANSECGADQRCSSLGECVELLSPECPDVIWPRDRDHVVFVGSVLPTGAPFSDVTQPHENSVQLALEDFSSVTTLQGDRGVAWVRCDDTPGLEATSNATQHLVEAVEAVAIIGPFSSEAVASAAEHTVPAGTFVITPTASAMNTAELDDNDLVWRTIPGDIYQSRALVDRFRDLDQAGGVDNLLILAKEDAYGGGILAEILDDLEADLPAVTAATYENPTHFQSQEEMLTSYGVVLAGISGDGPFTHVLIVGDSEAQVLLYMYLGNLWDGIPGNIPLFTVTHGAVPELERIINDIGPGNGTEALVPAKSLIEANLQGTSPVALNPVHFSAFGIRYRIRFNDEEPTIAAALSYDATLAALFAMCTIPGDEPVSGAAIAAGMPRLVDSGGTFVSFSGSDLSFITDARNALVVDGGSVDLQGVSGELHWELETGDVRADVWGWDITDMSGDGSDPIAAPSRVYCLAPEPATDGTWEGPEAAPATCG